MAERTEHYPSMPDIIDQTRHEPHIEIFQTPEAVDQAAAAIFLDTINTADAPNIVLATGETMRGFYAHLREAQNAGQDFSRIRAAFALDEYVNINPWDITKVIGRAHPGSFREYFRKELTGINLLNLQIPDSQAIDPFAEARVYQDKFRKAGKVNIALLGIGPNGHIGFNEPDSEVTSHTRVVQLNRETREANAKAFGSVEQTPQYAITLGIADILSAEKILLLAKGKSKAPILAKAIKGEVTSAVPASFLKLHTDVTILADKEAGAEIE